MTQLSMSHSLLGSLYSGAEIRYHVLIPFSVWTEHVMNNRSNYYNSVAFEHDYSTIMFKHSEQQQKLSVKAQKYSKVGKLIFSRNGYSESCLLTYEQNSDSTVTLIVKMKRDSMIILITTLILVLVGIVFFRVLVLQELPIHQVIVASVFGCIAYSFFVMQSTRPWFVDLIEKWFENIENQHKDSSQPL